MPVRAPAPPETPLVRLGRGVDRLMQVDDDLAAGDRGGELLEPPAVRRVNHPIARIDEVVISMAPLEQNAPFGRASIPLSTVA